MRKDDYDAILDAADKVKAARGTPAHDKAIAKAKAVVSQSKANQKADTKAAQKAAAVERSRVTRRGNRG